MNDEKLKNQLGANIVMYRKRDGLTQAGLAEKLNYSDKAVSKWERGESTPDVLTLVQLAELFDVTVNDLLSDPDALPENTGPVEKVMERAVQMATKNKANKRSVLALSSLCVWFLALLSFVIVSSLDIHNSWLAFIYAIPVDAIVRLSLRSAWRDCRWNIWLVSAIMWGLLLSVYMSLMMFGDLNIWKLFLLGIPGQLAVYFAFRIKIPRKEEHHG